MNDLANAKHEVISYDKINDAEIKSRKERRDKNGGK